MINSYFFQATEMLSAWETLLKDVILLEEYERSRLAFEMTNHVKEREREKSALDKSIKAIRSKKLHKHITIIESNLSRAQTTGDTYRNEYLLMKGFTPIPDKRHFMKGSNKKKLSGRKTLNYYR